MVGSRFDWRKPLTLERLSQFVALDNITAQTPLVEVVSPVRIWTSYDITRTCGTFTEVNVDGCVKTVTIYPSGKRHEILNRPKDNVATVSRAKKSGAVKGRPRRVTKVPRSKKAAVPKK